MDGVSPLLVGRDRDRRRLRALIDDARRGQGGAIRIDGPAGVGKSALLASVVPDDLRCLTTTGTETESSLPLAGLEQLLAALPGPDATVHDGADPAALLRTVSERIAAEAPLVVLVDDAQWLDPSSRDAVVFLARRAHRLGIALIAVWSVRGPAPAPWPDVPVLALHDLDPADAVELARARGLAPAVAGSVVAAIGGNPLALTELPRQLTAAQRAGRALLPDPLPVGTRLQQAFADRSGDLP
ncbi:MAG: AAA family ATPase, partial [Patulibacter sp.]